MEFCISTLWNNAKLAGGVRNCYEGQFAPWIPIIFIWLFTGIDVCCAVRNSRKEIPWNLFNISKIVVTLILAITQICLLIFELNSNSTDTSISYNFSTRFLPALRISTFVIIGILIIIGKSYGICSSGTQFTFWLLMVVCEVGAFWTAIENITHQDPVREGVRISFVKLAFYPLLVIAFMLNCFADELPPSVPEEEFLEKNSNLEHKASIASRLTFYWFEGLARKGYKEPLKMTDLWGLNFEDKSSSLVKRFQKYWLTPFQDAVIYKRGDGESCRIKVMMTAKKQIMKLTVYKSILPALLKMFGPQLLLAAFLKLINDLLSFAFPQILKLLINYVKKNEDDDQAWKGYFYVFLLLFISIIQTLFLNQYFHQVFLLGMRLRTTLINIIYRKSLVISNSARREFTAGEISILHSVDSQKFLSLIFYVNMIWSGPLLIGISFYFLWGILGPAVLAGFTVLVVLILLNCSIGSKTETIQMEQMKQKDLRVNAINEMLSGIKVLKLYAWEEYFASRVQGFRKSEMKLLKCASYIHAALTFLCNCTPFLVAVASFATFVLWDSTNVLDAEVAFVALSLFNNLKDPISQIPMTISIIIKANVSLKRINQFMNAEELDSNPVSRDAGEGNPVVIEWGFFSWSPDETPFLKNINLRVNQGALIAICGPVGSGKSTFLSALLGEMFTMYGRINIKGKVAYVSQQAWIQNASVRDNILFGQTFDLEKYEKVLDACALRSDLEILEGGDKTEIGEKGVNLSGGQRQRISLARAAYYDGDIFLFDDPLSALDPQVSKHVFENLMGPKGLLRNKTRIFVTHGVTYLPYVDQIVLFENGQIKETGSYRDFAGRENSFGYELLQIVCPENEEHAENAANGDTPIVQVVRRRTKKYFTTGTICRDHKTGTIRSAKCLSRNSFYGYYEAELIDAGQLQDDYAAHGTIQTGPTIEQDAVEIETSKLIAPEKVETGSVMASIYCRYFGYIGWFMTFFAFISFSLSQALSAGSDVVLSIWSNSNEKEYGNGENVASQYKYLLVYVGLGFGQGIWFLIASIVLAFGVLRASNVLHFKMLKRIIRARMEFFDTNPIGRIANRVSQDVEVCDNSLRAIIESFVSSFLKVVSIVVVISYTTPLFIVVVLPIGVLYFFIQRFYVSTSRQLKRLESTSRSPIYSHFIESITGPSTIRSYGVQDRFISESEVKFDRNQMCYYPSIVSCRWLAVRLETVGNLIIFFAALFVVIQRKTLTPAMAGLSITNALSVTHVLNWLVRMSSALETEIVAVERIHEYTKIPQEADWTIPGTKPPTTWPETGEIVFKNYQTRYREGMDLVLRGISCTINPSEKVGVVGRTGAGKSSLTLALFRIIESVEGSIFIDGKDISTLGLHDLRSRLTIIPQDPVLFSGTLRVNLDPFDKFSDEKIWGVLELSHLSSFFKEQSGGLGLQYEVTAGGENLSVGQRQLVCLARALLRKTKILILDEATAGVDLETDKLVQQTILTEFTDCTVLTIAHRLNTIMDCTRVIVMDKGEICEFDRPQILMKNTESNFYAMSRDSTNREAN